jgi:hypothetical protein
MLGHGSRDLGLGLLHPLLSWQIVTVSSGHFIEPIELSSSR